MTLKKEFGKRLRRWRCFRDLTQIDLAAVLDLTPVTISNFERGSTGPNFTTIEKICKALDVPVWELLPEPQKKPGQSMKSLPSSH